MEHGVYVCSWSQSSEGYALWIKSHPQIRAEGSTYADAEDRFIEAIHRARGVVHAVLEFDPQLPKSALETKYTTPELYLIVGDVRFETNAPRGGAFETVEAREDRFKWADDFFESPICRECAYAFSPRSTKPLFLDY